MQQYFQFADQRMGIDEAHPLLVANSGFHIHATMEKDAAGKYWIRIKKTPEDNHGAGLGLMQTADTNEVSVEIK